MFYKNYTKKQGSVVAKDHTNTKHGRTIRQDFYCHRAGKLRPKVFDVSKMQRKIFSSKCGCMALTRITLKRCFDIFSEEWHVTKLAKVHNHDMLSNEELRFLPANRFITPEDKTKILMYKEEGLSVRQTIRVMELEKKIQHGELTFFIETSNIFNIKLGGCLNRLF